MVRRPRIVQHNRTAERLLDSESEASLHERIDRRWQSGATYRDDLAAPASARPTRMRQLQLENVHPLRLRLLLEIERTGSISSAAEACSIAQPSASMHLRTLENATGQRLVARHGRGSRLTPAGRIVASHADRVLAILDDMRQTLDELDGPTSTEPPLAASLMPSLVLLPPILRAFSNRCPRVDINLQTRPSQAVVRDVIRGVADIGIAAEVPATGAVVSREILVDELIGIAPPGLVAADDGRVSGAELERHTLIVGSSSSSTRVVTERLLAAAGHRPGRVWVLDSYEAITHAVSEGLGVSFASRLLVRDAIERGEVIPFYVLGVQRMVRPIYALRSSTRKLTPEGVSFMEILIDPDADALRPSPATVTGNPWWWTSLGASDLTPIKPGVS